MVLDFLGKKVIKHALCMFIVMESIAMESKVGKIVCENAGDPSKIIGLLKEIRSDSELADAFLYNFGGKHYQKESNATKSFSKSIEDELKEYAFIIASKIRKIGALQIDKEDDLLISKRFLDFVKEKKDCHYCVDEDVSYSFSEDQLNSMIKNRSGYRNAVLNLQKIKKEDCWLQEKEIPEDMLADL